MLREDRRTDAGVTPPPSPIVVNATYQGQIVLELPGVARFVYTRAMPELVDPEDLIDATSAAEALGLANRTSVSVYQRRYPTMPRPVVDLGRGRTKLWSRKALASWARSADLRSPQAIASAELAQLGPQGDPLAQSIFRSSYIQARQHALGGSRKPREVGRSRRASYQLAFDQAVQVDPAFRVRVPDGWLEDSSA